MPRPLLHGAPHQVHAPHWPAALVSVVRVYERREDESEAPRASGTSDEAAAGEHGRTHAGDVVGGGEETLHEDQRLW